MRSSGNTYTAAARPVRLIPISTNSTKRSLDRRMIAASDEVHEDTRADQSRDADQFSTSEIAAE